MPASLVCPSCGSATTYHRPPVTTCPNCQAALPDALRQAAEASLLRQKAPRPTLLTIGLYTAPAAGIVLVLAVLLAAFNASFVRYTINGETVSGHEFLRTAGAAFGAMGIASLAIAFGVWKERAWTRYLIMAFWAVVLATNIGFGWAQSGFAGVVSAVAGSALVVVLVGWYLFGKENVVEYYQALEREQAAEETRARGGKGAA
jgi:FtsH-binding integral membrane protein